MSKKPEHHVDISPKVVEPTPQTGCVVCGGYEGLADSGSGPRWHAACAESRPDVIAKVKART